MSSHDNGELDRKLQQLEAKINSKLSPELKTKVSRSLESGSEKFVSWYKGLSSTGRLVVLGAGIFLGLSVLNMFVHMVASLASLAFLALIVYIVYKVFLEDDSSIK